MIEIALAPAVPRNDTLGSGSRNDTHNNGKQNKISWQNSPSVQRLLDVISSILAEEYITVAKQNPEVFSEIASPHQGGARNDYYGMETKE